MTKQQPIVLELMGVSRSFLQGNETIRALRKTDFVVRAGELIAVIGPSGSGKSTFLTVAGGLQGLSSGSRFINGVDTTSLTGKELSVVRLRDVGFILQASNLVPFLTVKKQLELLDRVSHRKTDKDAMSELLKKLDIAELQEKYPSDLSGGERQRVAIAKALYGTSKLILADEPTASLDTKKAFEVVELLARETRDQDKATVMVTHDERLVEYCDEVYEMHDGVLSRRKSHKRLH